MSLCRTVVQNRVPKERHFVALEGNDMNRRVIEPAYRPFDFLTVRELKDKRLAFVAELDELLNVVRDVNWVFVAGAGG
jgi:hypothetical protein